MSIELRAFGATGVEVTALGYGSAELAGTPRHRPVADDDAATLLNAVLDSGIALIDTAPDYGPSQDLIGKCISSRRDEYFLASKCGCFANLPPETPQPLPHDYGRANIRLGVEQSLTRMRTDHLDLVQIHLSPSVDVLREEETLEELALLRKEGKTRFIGMSGTLPELPRHIEMGFFDAFQIPYSALQREHEDLITQAAETGAGVIVRSGVAKGAPVSRGNEWNRSSAAARERWEKRGLSELLEGSMDPMEFLLRFALTTPGAHSVVVGTSRPEHLQANVRAAEKGPLSPALYKAAIEVLSSDDQQKF